MFKKTVLKCLYYMLDNFIDITVAWVKSVVSES